MSSTDFGTIIEIGDILISEDVVCEFFACDYEACKGACCIEGDSGAPLEEEEAERLEREYPEYSALMSEAGRARTDEVGFFEIDREGDMVTPCVPGSCECAFCVMGLDGFLRGTAPEPSGGALCAIELAGLSKPVSCALYPIRITRMPGGGLALNLHRWRICAPAFEKGKREGIRAYQFLEKPLIRRFGTDFYEALCAAARHIL